MEKQSKTQTDTASTSEKKTLMADQEHDGHTSARLIHKSLIWISKKMLKMTTSEFTVLIKPP